MLDQTLQEGRPGMPQISETEFEKRRGISRVEVRPGYAQVHISGLSEPIVESRLRVLEAVAQAGISLDFLKLSPGGISFLVAEGQSEALQQTLNGLGVRFNVQGDRRIVMVHAVNMRDEEGLIANIVLQAIGTGASVDHIADMHDRMMLVMSAQDAERVCENLERDLVAGVRA